MAEGPSAAGGLTFLLEVGCEEIPAPMIPRALADLADGLKAALGGLASAAAAKTDLGGPRRLVAWIEGIKAREEDREETVTGPPRSAAYDAQGTPTRAAVGFAKGQGVDVSDLRIVATSRGEVVAATKRVRGRAASEILAASCPGVLGALRFAKTMRWGDRGYVFVRPVHWILALLDSEVVRFEFAGVRSGRLTRGHRHLGPGPHEVARPSDYERLLRESGAVTPRIEERRRLILDLAGRAAAQAGGRLRPDPDLLGELTFLTEHPAVERGSFAEGHLALPAPVLLTTMRHHQKYLTIERSDGRLLNSFVAVLTTEPDPSGLIRRGNEWVLGARLADARFFFEEDRRRPLGERVGDLARVTFHARLGTYADKVERLRALVEEIAPALRLGPAEARDAREAARLCKADLTTGMVGEFPELQGVMGGIYARLEGLSEGCARAIEEHYLPDGAGGPIPSPGAPAAVALADKIDTLATCFAAGFTPRGSADPYGLRRAAQGTLRTILENRLRLDLEALLGRALALAKSEAPGAAPPGVAAARGGRKEPRKERAAEAPDPAGALAEFLRQRLRFLMEESGIRFDAARAVLAVGWRDPLLAWRRAEALNGLRGRGDFLALAAAAKRVRNILAQAAAKGLSADGKVDPGRLAPGPEADLCDAMRSAAGRAADLAARDDHAGALSAIATLRPAVDLFFDKVLVMDPDASVRANRLALLSELSGLLSSEADFAEIVVEGESPA